MFLPFLLILFALVATAVVMYGTHPYWGQYGDGIHYIMLVRQWEWPMIALAIVLCLALVGLVAAGKRRIWWLIGLAPVLVMVVGHFTSERWNPIRVYSINAAPTFSAAPANLADDDYVVGLTFNKVSYAFPYASLYFTPVVVINDHDQPRAVLMWSPFANRATAAQVSLDLHPKDLEIVSMPANGLLLYNSKHGEFISGITGLTSKGERPSDFVTALTPEKMTWKAWKAAHPDTLVMAAGSSRVDPKAFNMPAKNLWFAMPPVSDSLPANEPIVMLPGTIAKGTLPIAVRQGTIPREKGVSNHSTPQEPYALVRLPDGGLKAFVRPRKGDAASEFSLNTSSARKGVLLVDKATKAGWGPDGKPVDLAATGDLPIIPLDPDLNWSVMKVWIPDLRPVDLGMGK